MEKQILTAELEMLGYENVPNFETWEDVIRYRGDIFSESEEMHEKDPHCQLILSPISDVPKRHIVIHFSHGILCDDCSVYRTVSCPVFGCIIIDGISQNHMKDTDLYSIIESNKKFIGIGKGSNMRHHFFAKMRIFELMTEKQIPHVNVHDLKISKLTSGFLVHFGRFVISPANIKAEDIEYFKYFLLYLIEIKHQMGELTDDEEEIAYEHASQLRSENE